MSENKPHYHGHRQRLKERFLNSGLDSLQPYEVLELLLMQAIPRKDVKPLAKELLTKYKTLNAVLGAPLEELTSFNGIGEGAALSLKLYEAIAQRYKKEAARKAPLASKIELLDYLYTKVSTLNHEEFHVVYLDAKNNIISDEMLFRGTVNSSAAYPREVMKEAMKNGAASLILVHNHPSGDPTPSLEDESLTIDMMQAASLIGVKIQDHIIIGNEKHYSFADRGKLLP